MVSQDNRASQDADNSGAAGVANERHLHVHVHVHDNENDGERDSGLVDANGHRNGTGKDDRDGGDEKNKSGGDGEQKGGHENDGNDGNDDQGEKGDEDGKGKDGKDGKRKGPGKKPLIILGIVVLLIAIVAIVFWFSTRNQESTDDAFTDGNAATIAPKVSGYVTKLAVNDNQRVKQGDLLVEIDPRDYIARRDEAAAQVGLARSQLHQAEVQYDLAKVQYPAQLSQARAQETSAQASLTNANSAYARQHGVDPRATSQQSIDQSTAQQRSARADVANAQAQVKVAAQIPLQLRRAAADVEARRQQVEQAKAQLAQAELNLSYTQLRAPYDGYVTRRNVQLGSLVQAGTSLFSLVSPMIWVTANFKESQLTKMRPGDKVAIEVDAYPDLNLSGHVDSVQQGTGSRFSAFPAENATGNYVKIVQRVPVKIVIDHGLDPNRPLPLGISVTPKVTLQ
ncbi:HlyD family secretion protein [Robbsia sp. Bb-Pol-6]|uniref:HlyD family secretion protein n=1 Tax=Robbsia betulipollinis TaxID=2981849 RepID=A0ABT3ZNI0_9BURK|nr:HlyD family secretion protein [Robbsia betulipollinis]MCY0388106.1 HlyD family secretion protein [Robbsia betulipollinis]